MLYLLYFKKKKDSVDLKEPFFYEDNKYSNVSITGAMFTVRIILMQRLGLPKT